MSDISDLLIKDSYDFVIQCDFTTGIIYRIGGNILINPKFLSGLTVNNSFNFSDGSEQDGYVLTSDGSGNGTWKPISGVTVSGNFLPISGGTVTGNTVFEQGLTATTISATTYQGLPLDVFVTGGTYSGGTITFVNNSGGTFDVSGLTSSSGLTYYVTSITPITNLKNGDRWFNTNTGVELVWIDDGNSTQWIQPFSVPGPQSQDLGYYTTTGITNSQTLTWDKTYWGISGNSNTDLVLPSSVGKNGYYLIIKDESGTSDIYRIRISPTSGKIDGGDFLDINVKYKSATCIVREGNWFTI